MLTVLIPPLNYGRSFRLNPWKLRKEKNVCVWGMSYIPQAYIKGKPKFLTALNLLLGIARSSFWGR